jgi:hypothetical protein
MQRNWSKQEKLWTLWFPQYRKTHLRKIVHGQKVHQLRKNSAADIHRPFLFAERNWNGYIAGKMANASELNCLQGNDPRSEGKK